MRYLRGFAQIQNLLERALLTTMEEKSRNRRSTMANDQSNNANPKDIPVVFLQQFPHPKFISEE